ncbi:lysine--tRNA ligase [Patescibacteria group bacterium]|nr:lysine--tRNA ligase [Patescibacteria group bacterium]
MIWVDREANRLKERGLALEWADDMKTPSGRIHVGSLRGVIVHDLIYKALIVIGVKAKFSYVFNDMDPMDGLPTYLDKDVWEKYMGYPLYKIPSPEKNAKSFADYFAQEFISVFNSLNCNPQIIWSSKLYQSGKMDPIIKLILDNADKVREIYKQVAKADKPSNWFPYNPVCEKCGKIGTTNVHKWDGKHVYYRCEYHMVEWATGCGYEGKVEPIKNNGKLPWKLDWPAHWKAIGITVESSGKDHMSSGGSYDMAVQICSQILGIKAPDALGGYEWFTVGGKKMSSSKGIGSSAKEVAEILPPDLFRFLQVRTPIKTHLDFNPFGDTIPRLFDDYDRCLDAYFLKLEKNLPPGKNGEVLADFSRIIELSEVKPLPKNRIFIPRFRTIAGLLLSKTRNIEAAFEKQAGRKLTKEELSLLQERIRYAKIYLDKYATKKEDKVTTFTLNDNQKKFLTTLKKNLSGLKGEPSRQVDIYHKTTFDTIKKIGIKPKEAFSAFYNVLNGKPYGKKAGELIVELGVDKVIKLIDI